MTLLLDINVIKILLYFGWLKQKDLWDLQLTSVNVNIQSVFYPAEIAQLVEQRTVM